MLYALLALALVAGAAAAPQRPQQGGSDKDATIISQTSVNNGDGSFQYSYETSNGISADEQGQLKNAGNPETEAMSVQGRASWTSPDGQKIDLTWVADENGFQPQGAHLPTPPPIPEEILKGLAYNMAHPEEDDIDSQQPGNRPPARGRK